MKVRELFETPDFSDKEMPTYSTGNTFNFYSEDTIKRDFDVIDISSFKGDKAVTIISKTKKFAVIGRMGIRKEDKKVGIFIIGTVEFKDTPNISYKEDIPTSENVLQVDSAEIKPKDKTKGFGVLLYCNLAKYGFVIISDNFQYIGGKALWKKIASLAQFRKLNVYIIENGKPMLDEDGKPIKYDGSNIDDADIWAAPTSDITKSKRYTLLMLRK